MADEGDLDIEDLIAEEDVIITVSRAGYVKRLPVDAFQRQGRGGKGVRGQNLKEEDVVKHVFTTTTHHWMLFFTTKGRVYRVKAHAIPESGRDRARALRGEPARAWRSTATSRSAPSSTSRSTRRASTCCSPRARAS